MLRRRLGAAPTYPARIVGGAVGMTPDPLDGSARYTAAPLWEGRASLQPLSTDEAVTTGRAVETLQAAVFLPPGVAVTTGQTLQLCRETWEDWDIYRVESWPSYTYALIERERSPYA